MKLFTQALLDELAVRAAASPRGRAHHTIHAGDSDPVQRFLVCANRGSYFRPHRHVTRAELTWVVRGAFTVLTFDAEGCVLARYEVGGNSADMGYEIPQGTWHTLLPRSDGATFLEVKQGPYDPASSAEFAPWAPAEGQTAVASLLEWAHSAQPGDVAPRS